ncbi:MAG TPA: SIS domain-containing protein [Candidatus Eremiobacteraceae bacterium]|nr:SIS domain-containing protein [Candidatus Eremiobacteraceae bacterium]
MSEPVKIKTFADCIAERTHVDYSGYAASVQQAVDAIVKTIQASGRVFWFGNGGSAAMAQHFAAELSGRFLLDRPAWGSVALSVDTSALTAIANDYGFETVFARQLQGLCRRGDVAVGLTTSGNSPNVVKGLSQARECGATTVALSGNGGGDVMRVADVALVGPSGPSWKVQEVHLALGHIICELVELRLVGR